MMIPCRGWCTLLVTSPTDAVFILCTCSGRSLPFDFIKTRMQKMDKGPDGKLPYAGSIDCAVKTFKTEVMFRETSNSSVLSTRYGST